MGEIEKFFQVLVSSVFAGELAGGTERTLIRSPRHQILMALEST